MKKLLVAAVLILGACAGDSSDDGPITLTLIAHESFTPSDGIFDSFTAETGIVVEIINAGDAGEIVTKAVLTSGNPEGDVLWGVDNALLPRALDAKVFEPYKSVHLEAIPVGLREGIPNFAVTPVDSGDVCINFDIAWHRTRGIDPPSTLADLANSARFGHLVVQSPLTSSPGLAFMLGTIVVFGEEGWLDYWAALRANDLRVVDGWTEAYYNEFSGSQGGGVRPLVVSYGSSPPAEVLFADPPRDDAPTGVATETCFRQVEYAGILRGTKHPQAARLLIDFLIGETFQADLPLTQFVYPANAQVALPEVFTTYSARPTTPLTMSPDRIAANRVRWLDEWTATVLK
jgi:thiamine transport system substrate-binding protein